MKLQDGLTVIVKEKERYFFDVKQVETRHAGFKRAVHVMYQYDDVAKSFDSYLEDEAQKAFDNYLKDGFYIDWTPEDSNLLNQTTN